MLLSLLLYAAVGLAAVGAISIVLPVRVLGIRSRWIGALVMAAGAGTASLLLSWPQPETMSSAGSAAIDEFSPVYQFSERQEIPVRASARQVFDAMLTVSADEIPFYRPLVWFRRGGISGPESILNPPDGVPLLEVATRTSFVKLAERPPHEFVMGTVVIAPPGVRLAVGSTTESFKALTQPGFAKTTVAFSVEPLREGWCLLRTDTRVYATDDTARATFTRYWRVIAPGSAFVRLMWLRAIKVRAETVAPPPRRLARTIDESVE